MSAGSYNLDSLRVEIDTHIAARMPAMAARFELAALPPSGRLALERLSEFTGRPGKRIRGALSMVAYEAFGGSSRQAALDAALAIELVQSYLLVIDDVMDRSVLRRGGPTVHVQYRQQLEGEYPLSDAEHLSNMLAVSVGLIGQHLAALVLNDVREMPERVMRAERLLQANIATTTFGQIEDLMNEAGQAMSLDDVRRMYMLKSSYYSFVNPLQLGAVLAGADDAALESIKQFGEHAGLAFQLQDDILGMFGDERTTGKSSLDDLREGKMTLLIRCALARADVQQLAVLRAALGNKDVTLDEHKAVQIVLADTGSREYVSEEAKAAASAALAVLDAQSGWQKAGKDFLSELVAYIVTRER